ncbi:hypothetical protein ACFWPH_33325, partial [Nocardia sp. NPDC058499]
MSIECSTVVAVPRSEVFAWFARPGAFARLAPPWQPVSLLEEADLRGRKNFGQRILVFPTLPDSAETTRTLLRSV